MSNRGSGQVKVWPKSMHDAFRLSSVSVFLDLLVAPLEAFAKHTNLSETEFLFPPWQSVMCRFDQHILTMVHTYSQELAISPRHFIPLLGEYGHATKRLPIVLQSRPKEKETIDNGHLSSQFPISPNHKGRDNGNQMNKETYHYYCPFERLDSKMTR